MIVYVEDNLNSQRLMQRMLSKRGLTARVYDNVEDAYQAIRSQPPALLLVDQHLKTRLTGLDLVQMLRQDGLEMPIVIVTVFNMIAERNQALEAGCDAHLSKPYSMAEVLSILDQFLPSDAGADNSAASTA